MLLALMVYMNGVVLMLLTDAQKYLVLRERKERKLINHCMHGWSRNMNYVGEIMLYAAFGILVQRWEVWAIYSYMWCIIFMIRMNVKDYSLSKKEGWETYREKTWLLVPKLLNSDFWSYLIYGVTITAGYLTYENGGIEKTLKLLF